MNEAIVGSAAPKKRRSWLKLLGWIIGAVIVLLIAGYFVGTSAAFFKGVILPQASKAINADVTVTDASISPFSQVLLRDFKVQAKGAEPLVTAAEVRVRYSLMDIIGGKINVDEISVSDLVVHVVVNADGTSNLDVLTKKKSTHLAPAPPPSKAGPPPKLDIKKIAINNGLVSFTQFQKDGSKTTGEVAGLNFGVENLKNGQPAKLSLGTNLKFAQGAAPNISELAASLKSAFGIDLGSDLMPTQIKGDTEVVVTSATGALADVAQLNTKLSADLSLTEVKQIALNFTKGGAALGLLQVRGPFDALNREGKLTMSVTGIGNEVLSLAGARFGIYFGSTKLAANYDIELKDKGRFVNTTGTITADKFSLTRSNLTTPAIDIQLAYSATIDLPRTNATLRAFSLNATQTGRPLLQAGLTKEMFLDWGKGPEAVADSALELTLNEFKLADWKPFLGEVINSGVVNGKLVVNVQKAGRLIIFDLNSKLTGLSGQFGSNYLDKADLALASSGQMTDFDKIELGNLALDASRLGQPVASVKASGRFAAQTRDADLQTELKASLARVSELLARPDLSLTDGMVAFSGHVSQKSLTPAQTNGPSLDQSLTGKLQVTDLTGRLGSNRFDRLAVTADLDAGAKNNLAEIRKCAGMLCQSGQAGGNFEVTGNYQLMNQAGEVAFRLIDLNQNALRSFVVGAMAPMSLDTVSINATATARYDRKGDSALKGGVQIVNLLISDPKGQLPKVPMTAEFTLEAGLSRKGVAEVSGFTGNFQQGSNAAGSFAVTCRYDLTNQAGQLALKLTDLNQNGLAPFLAPALGDKKLVSVSINANLDGRYDAKADSAIKGDLQISNLVINDPKGQIPSAPLEAKLKLDGGLRKQMAEIRDFVLTLTPTERAKNELALKGQVDFSQTNAIQGGLKLSADSLDVTRYYDLFAGKSRAAVQTPAAPASGTAVPPDSNKEPDAVKLPFKNFTLDASIGRLYLREVDIANLQVGAKVDGGHVLVKPLQLTLNGASIGGSADLDLGVAGFKYDVAFNANAVPLAPLVSSFVPERKGQIGGSTTASAQLKGAGVTGASLQKNLAGQFGFTATNMNLSLANVRSPMINTVINVIVGIPNFIRDPTAAVGSFLGRLTGASSTHSGWADKLTASPIQAIDVRGNAGSGRIELQEAAVRSAAFLAETAGSITLAPVLTNSAIQFPVTVSLSHSLADEVGLVPAGTPTNALYARLPDFLTMRGTLGQPDPKIDKLALATVALKSGAGVASQIGGATGGKVGSLLNVLGGVVGAGGTVPAAPNTNRPVGAQTNAPPPNQLLPINPFDLFKKRN